MTADLSAARAHLHDLEGQTSSLQAQADSEARALIAAQDQARTGRAPLRLVVTAQGLADAARGLLRRHLGDVEQQRTEVQELERSHAIAQLVERGRAAQAEADRAALEGAEIIAQAEAALSDALTRFQAAQDAHRSARAQVLTYARQHVAHALGLPEREVSEAMNWRGNGPVGPLGAERRAAVTGALGNFGATVGTTAQALTAAANQAAPELSPGRLGNIMPR